MEACAKFCPEAVVGLIVNPVNSVVPAMCEMWRKKGLKGALKLLKAAGLNPAKIVGVPRSRGKKANYSSSLWPRSPLWTWCVRTSSCMR